VQPNELLTLVVNALEAVGAKYMLTGSVASTFYGAPRLTNDIDLVVELDETQAKALAAFFPAEEFYFDLLMVRDAIARCGQFNVIHGGSGLKVDVMLRRPREFSATEFARRIRAEILPGREIAVARPEDVILAKLEYHRDGGSDKHLRDIRGILAESGDQLDHAYLDLWAERLGVLAVWRRLRDEA
jgi:hypothetical protein